MKQRRLHIAACLLLLMAAWLHSEPATGRHASPGPSAADLIEMAKRAGLVYVGQQAFLQDERYLTFSTTACAHPLGVLILPYGTPLATASRALLQSASGRLLVVLDGSVVDDADPQSLMPRLLWRKLLVAVHLQPRGAWSSAALVVVVPAGCKPPVLDWS